MKRLRILSLLLVIAIMLTNFGGIATFFTDLVSITADAWTPSDDDWITDSHAPTDYAYSFALVGDTQTLLWYDLQNTTTNLETMYDWIVDNAESKKIQCVMGLGDITETNNLHHYQEGTANEWEYAYNNINKLKENNIPFTIVRGNHDKNLFTHYIDRDYYFNKYFPSSYLGANDGSYDSTMQNTYKELTIGETQYLIVNLDCGVNSDPTKADAILEWANDIVEAHGEKYGENSRVIVTTHIYLLPNGSRGNAFSSSTDTSRYGLYGGEVIWDKFVRKHENICLVLSGHEKTHDIGRSQAIGDNGNIITQLMVDPQNVDLPENHGGTGLVAMLYFSEDGETVDVEYISTVREKAGLENKYFREENQFSFNIEKGNVLYVSSDGTGDGSSPDSPLGNDSDYDHTYSDGNWNDVSGNAFIKALNQLQGTGGTIVLVGETSLDVNRYVTATAGKRAYSVLTSSMTLDVGGSLEASKDPNGLYTSASLNKRPTITITSVHNGVDYRKAENGGAKLVLDHSKAPSMNLQMRNPSIWKDLNIEYRYNPDFVSSWNGTQNGIIAPSMIQCDYMKTVFDTGIVCTSYNTKTQSEGDIYPGIVAGVMYETRSGDTNLTVKSGTWNFISAAGYGQDSDESGTVFGNAVLDIQGGIIGEIYGTGSIYRQYGTVTGTVDITVSGGQIGNVYLTNNHATNTYQLSLATKDSDGNYLFNDTNEDGVKDSDESYIKETVTNPVQYAGSGITFTATSDAVITGTIKETPAGEDLTNVTVTNNAKTASDLFTYTLDSDNNATITGYTGTSTDISIPSTIDGYTVTSLAKEAFNNCGLTSVSLPASITSMGDRPFVNNKYLQYITVDKDNTVYHSENNCLIETATKVLIAGTNNSVIPFDGSVTSIKNHAFYDLEYLANINIPSSITSIGRYSFYSCANLAHVYYEASSADGVTIDSTAGKILTATSHYDACMGDGVNHAHSYTDDCDAICNNCLKTTREIAPSLLFDYTKASGKVTIDKYKGTVLDVVIPSTIEGYPVTAIGAEAFKNGNNAVTSVVIPDSVVSIGYRAINSCENLTSVTIGKGLTSIGDQAFAGAKHLESINVDEDNTTFHVSGGCLIETATKVLILGTTDAVIPSDGSVTNIKNHAFYNNRDITSIVIPDTVTKIQRYAFCSCRALATVVLPSSVTTIEVNAFGDCRALTNVYYEGSSRSEITTLNVDTANGYSNTQYFTNDSLCTWNYGSCMKSSSHAHSFTDSSDADCNNCLKTINEVAADLLFTYTETDTAVTIETYIGKTANVTIPSTINGKPVTAIAASAFSGNKIITGISIPSSVTSIGEKAFSGIQHLATISVEEGNSTYHSSGNCLIETTTKLLVAGTSNSVIPSDGSVTNIKNHAFFDNRDIKSIVIPDSVTKIQRYAFCSCRALATIVLPSSVTTIEVNAFGDCRDLTNVYYEGSSRSAITTLDDSTANGYSNSTYFLLEEKWTYNYCTNGTNENPSHTFTNDCDDTCNNCNKTFEGRGHVYDNNCDTTCNVCSEVREVGDHVYDDEFDAVCNECSAERVIAASTIFDYATSNNQVTITGYKANYTEVVIPSTIDGNPVVAIGNNAFNGNKSITSVVIPDSVTTIGEYAFYNAQNITSLVISANVTTIERLAFHNCKKIKTVALPNTITEIARAAFGEWNALETVYFEGSESDKEALFSNISDTVVSGAYTNSYLKNATWICNSCIKSEDHTHSYGEWETTTPATPETVGSKQQTCENCNNVVTEEIPMIATLKIKTVSLTLENNLSVNYKVEKAILDAGYTNSYVKFELNGIEKIVENYTLIGDRYVFVFDNIAPNKMNDTISATLYATYNDVEYTSSTIEYSIKQYCYDTLEDYADDTYAKTRTLVVDLLNYGAESQLYSNYQTQNLVNADLTEQQAAWGTPDENLTLSNSLAVTERLDNATAKWKTAGLSLDDAVDVRLGFTADGIAKDSLSVKITSGNDEWTISSDDFIENDGVYTVYFDGLYANQMSKIIYITICQNGAAISNTISYNIESYAYDKQNSTIPYLADLVKAMMKYGNSAANYN